MKEAYAALQTYSHVLIAQAGNIDGDSLASALALEAILNDLDIKSSLYCGTTVPQHLKYLAGWDRVTDEVPNTFDAMIIVDASSKSLFTKLNDLYPHVFKKPVIIFDHHETEIDIDHEFYVSHDPVVSTGEIIYHFARENNISLALDVKELIASSIMSDSLGLTTPAVTHKTIEVVAELVKDGVSLSALNDKRRALFARPQEITKYKGELLSRADYTAEGRIAWIHIPYEETVEYSDKYNPPMLVMDDLRMTEGVAVVIAFKTYPDGKILVKIRSNSDAPICKDLAESFDGGGHPNASGIKTFDVEYDQLRQDIFAKAEELLDETI